MGIDYLVDVVRYDKIISLRKLSRLSGVTKSHIESIERNEGTPSLLVMCRLAAALEVPITDLFRYEDDRPKNIK